ncbi:hypothetical protein ACFCWY_27385 [Streptomyces sp. NPDC056362]|uniref:hypothetical protein n=1 Tax=unclassified Streptomyces TaxID=2593676 RepID=UPI0035E0A170
MPVEHADEGQVLAVNVPADLDVASRAAVALHIQRLVFAYRPASVRLHVARPATDASLSILARAHRLCEALGIPLTLTTHPWSPGVGPVRPGRDPAGLRAEGGTAA